MEIIVRSRSQARDFTSDRPWAAISISEYADELPKLNACQRVGLLQLIFKDTEFNVERCFQPEQAKQIIEFVNGVKDKIDTLLVHCYAGWSRSPAVAAAIDRFCNKADIKHYWEEYEPNMLVFKTLEEIWERETELPDTGNNAGSS